jgi:hypothetical protein
MKEGDSMMKKLLLTAAALMLLAPIAQAKNVELSGDAAESFLTRHFPDADIPGDVKGVFLYVNKHGETKRGYAECHYPAMGERSNGIVTTCAVIY